LFEEQAERTPEAMAVVFESERVTYGELNAKANQLAHVLRSCEVGAERIVGIMSERSVEMIGNSRDPERAGRTCDRLGVPGRADRIYAGRQRCRCHCSYTEDGEGTHETTKEA
ncbi:AMP-binding protein, partial [Paenibacillus rhizoplanae]